jgi:type IV pilus assembly protein PilM
MGNLLHRFTHLLQDPAPDYVFEVSEAGIAWAKPGSGSKPAFQPLEPGVLAVSPLSDNVLKADALAAAIRGITGAAYGRRRGRAVVLLPDYCARVSVLTFDQFPTDPKEQLPLVRFRMKKSVPFDVEAAALSFHSTGSGKGRTEVIVVVAALEIVARYEAAFRASGLHPGYVSTAAVAMSELNHAPGVSILARLNGRVLTVAVMNGSALKLVRTVELAAPDSNEIMGVLFPTMAYVEDEMGTTASRILMCGFDEQERIPEWASELQVPAEPLRSRFGVANAYNAGLFGYLESSSGGGVKAA